MPSAGKGFGIDLLVSGGTAAPTVRASSRCLISRRPAGICRQPRTAIREYAGFEPGRRPLRLLACPLRRRLTGDQLCRSVTAAADNGQSSSYGRSGWRRRAREWVERNLFGGTVSGRFNLRFHSVRRLDEAVGKGLKLDENQIRIAFDIAGTRMNVIGDIPPIRDTECAF